MPVQLLGKYQLGAHAIGTGHQHRFAVAVRQVEQAAEQTHTAQHFRAQGAFDQRLDAFDNFIAGVNVNARIAVGEGGVGSHGQSGGTGNVNFSF
jgi:hypothetical protein